MVQEEDGDWSDAEVEIQDALLCKDRQIGRGPADSTEVGNGRSRVSNGG